MTLTGRRNRILVLWLVLTAFLINLSILVLIPFLMHPELKPFGAPLEILIRPDRSFFPPAVNLGSPFDMTRPADRRLLSPDSPRTTPHSSEETAPDR